MLIKACLGQQLFLKRSSIAIISEHYKIFLCYSPEGLLLWQEGCRATLGVSTLSWAGLIALVPDMLSAAPLPQGLGLLWAHRAEPGLVWVQLLPQWGNCLNQQTKIIPWE